MCNLSKGVEEKGMQKGILTALRNLMDSMKVNKEEAMTLLKVPESEREQYAEELDKL